MKTLFLTEMSPNGTNDLLIVDNTGEVLDVIREATFGYNSNPDAALVWDRVDSADALNDPELIEAGVMALYRVKLSDVMRNIAVSPTADGSDTVREIKMLLN